MKKIIENLFSGDEYKISIVGISYVLITLVGCYLAIINNDFPTELSSILKVTSVTIIGGSAINQITNKGR